MPDMTRAEWRARRNVSKSTHAKLKNLGLAPDQYNVPGTRIARITEASDAAWELRMRELAQGEAARLEGERRRALAQIAGKAAAASPRHVSKRGARPAPVTRPQRRARRARS
jgi:hypothetical protein